MTAHRTTREKYGMANYAFMENITAMKQEIEQLHKSLFMSFSDKSDLQSKMAACEVTLVLNFKKYEILKVFKTD